MRFIKTYISIGWLILFCSICLHTNAQEIVDKKAFDENFKERYDSHKFNYEGDNVVSTSVPSHGEYSSDYEKEDVNIREDNNTSSSNVSFNGIEWLLIIVLIAAVVYLISILLNEGSGSWFHKNRSTSLKDHKRFNVETANPNDFEQLISKAENNNDYRLAIRYYYLLVLKSLSLKNIIEIEDDKTNAEYLNEIKNIDLNIAFSRILYVYNYTWYGEFAVNQQQYNIAKNNFQSLIKNIRK